MLLDVPRPPHPAQQWHPALPSLGTPHWVRFASCPWPWSFVAQLTGLAGGAPFRTHGDQVSLKVLTRRRQTWARFVPHVASRPADSTLEMNCVKNRCGRPGALPECNPTYLVTSLRPANSTAQPELPARSRTGPEATHHLGDRQIVTTGRRVSGRPAGLQAKLKPKFPGPLRQLKYSFRAGPRNIPDRGNLPARVSIGPRQRAGACPIHTKGYSTAREFCLLLCRHQRASTSDTSRAMLGGDRPGVQERQDMQIGGVSCDIKRVGRNTMMSS